MAINGLTVLDHHSDDNKEHRKIFSFIISYLDSSRTSGYLLVVCWSDDKKDPMKHLK